MPRIHSYPKEYENYVKQIQENLKFTTIKYLENFRDNLFKKFPRLKKIWWSQYSPRFNDGDRCYFYSHTDIPSVEILGSDFILDREEFINEVTGEYVNIEDENDDCKHILEIVEYSAPFLEVLDSRILDDIYGEATVVLYKDKIEAENVYIDE